MGALYRWAWLAAAITACTIALLLPQLLDKPKDIIVEFDQSAEFDATEQTTTICTALAHKLPGRVYSKQHPAFPKFLRTYWSTTAAESEPACVVQPPDAHNVATAMIVLKDAFDTKKEPLFAVRSGGHSPEPSVSSMKDGVVIDLSLLNDVAVSADRKTTIIGVGARWQDVYSKLDALGLAMVGGRNANVGVGGLALGGGISFLSPRYGMVCDNIDKYEIVQADGTLIHASADTHADLWRALKGGTGNFGIVTRVWTKTVPGEDIWAGYGYWASWQTSKVLKAFYDFNEPESFDAYAGGPILALSYVRDLGIKVIASSISYTKPVAWPPVFDKFRSIWRLWNTIKIQSLTEATQELDRLAPVGQRQYQVTTTIKNDLATFQALNNIYSRKLKEANDVKSAVWSLIFQPLSAAVTRKGSPNVLGLETRHANDTLIIVLIAVAWKDAEYDQLVERVAREMIYDAEQAAQSRGTADPYIYLNYAASGQKVFDGYGEANKEFLRKVSRLYDPDGFWQIARSGGFKLDVY